MSDVLSSRRKLCKDSMFLIELGRLFQDLDAATGNARSPRVERRVDGIINDKLSADRRQRRALTSVVRWRLSARYAGAEPWRQRWAVTSVVRWRLSARYVEAESWRQRWTRTHNQNWIRSGTRSQWSSRNREIMCSYFLAEKINRAAAFRTDCNLSIRWPVMQRVQKCSNRPCWPQEHESGSARRVQEEIVEHCESVATQRSMNERSRCRGSSWWRGRRHRSQVPDRETGRTDVLPPLSRWVGMKFRCRGEVHQSISVFGGFNSSRFDFNHIDASLTQADRLWQRIIVVVGLQNP